MNNIVFNLTYPCIYSQIVCACASACVCKRESNIVCLCVSALVCVLCVYLCLFDCLFPTCTHVRPRATLCPVTPTHICLGFRAQSWILYLPLVLQPADRTNGHAEGLRCGRHRPCGLNPSVTVAWRTSGQTLLLGIRPSMLSLWYLCHCLHSEAMAWVTFKKKKKR